MKYLLFLCATAVLFAAASSHGQKNAMTIEEQLLRTHALRINTENIVRELEFYTGALGFAVEDRSGYPEEVVLSTGDRVKLILTSVPKLRREGPSDAFTGLSLQVNDLDETIKSLKAKGVRFSGEKRKVGVGQSIYILDPSGRRISMLHQTVVETPHFEEPKMYNFGVTVPDMAKGREFYADLLGFVVRSEDYLPAALPLGHADGSFGFMVHWREGISPIKFEYPNESAFYTMVFETADLQATLTELVRRGVNVLFERRNNTGKLEMIAVRDSAGLVSEVVGG